MTLYAIFMTVYSIGISSCCIYLAKRRNELLALLSDIVPTDDTLVDNTFANLIVAAQKRTCPFCKAPPDIPCATDDGSSTHAKRIWEDWNDSATA